MDEATRRVRVDKPSRLPDRRKNATGWRKKETMTAHLMTVPALIPYILFGIIPIVWVLIISFSDYDGMADPKWAGLHNYAIAIRDAVWWTSAWHTLIFAGGKLILEIPLALVLAVMLNRKLAGMTFFRVVFFIPHITSIAVMSVIFFFIFRPLDGILNGLLQGIHLIGQPLDYLGKPVSAMASVIGVGIWHDLGLEIILILSGLQTIPSDVYESAALDGASSAQRLWYITVPLLGPLLRIVILLAILGTMRSFDLVQVLTGGGPYGSTDVMFTYIFKYFFGRDFGAQYGYGAALGVLATAVIGLVTWMYHQWTKKDASSE